MKLIENKILEDSKIIDNKILKVDNFLNHQVEVDIINAFAKETRNQFKERIDKVLTIETSGIAVAYAVCEAFDNVPLLFAKKTQSAITNEECYHAPVKSFTRNAVCDVIVTKKFLKEGENILIVDDFLAEGNAALGLIDICKQAKANVIGVAAVIEKTFQGGRHKIEDLGIKVFAGASIKGFKDNKPIF